MYVETATFQIGARCLNQLPHPIILWDQPDERSCRYTLEGMVLICLRKQTIVYSTNVDKEVKLLDLNYDESDIYKSIMNMSPIL